MGLLLRRTPAALLGTSTDTAELEGNCGSPGFSSQVHAVVSFAGPTDCSAMEGWHLEANSPESRLLGAPVKERPDLVQAANPIAYITPKAPPFLIMHGKRDNVVSITQSELLHAALQEAGVESTLVHIENGDHGFFGEIHPSLNESEQIILSFFTCHLKHT